MADFYNPIFAECMAKIQQQRRASGQPEVTSEHMQRLYEEARPVWDETMASLKASTRHFPPQDRPGAIRNDQSALLEVLARKVMDRLDELLKRG